MSTDRDTTNNTTSGGGGSVLVDPLGGLLLDPSNELRFKGPFDDYVTVSLTIKNPTEKRIAFKIKTTAPKRYCVKPNSGVLDPNQSMKVNVLLQPFNYDPNEKNKHKFMVQYLYLNESEMQLNVNDILSMWKDISATRLLDLKLKCLFDFSQDDQKTLAKESPAAPAKAEATSPTPVSKPSLSSSSTATASTPANNTTATTTANTANTTATKSVDEFANATATAAVRASARGDSVGSDFDSSSQTKVSPLASTTTGMTASAGANKNDNTLNELKLNRQENAVLKIENNRLKEEVAHLRKVAISSGGGGSASASSSSASNSLEINSLSDILNNRLVLIIIVLLAVIVYQLLFK